METTIIGITGITMEIMETIGTGTSGETITTMTITTGIIITEITITITSSPTTLRR